VIVRGRSNRGTTHHRERAARYHSRDEAATIFKTQRTQRTTTTATSSAQHHPRHDIVVGMTFRDARRSSKHATVSRREDVPTNRLRPETSTEENSSAEETRINDKICFSRSKTFTEANDFVRRDNVPTKHLASMSRREATSAVRSGHDEARSPKRTT
jgi:hypothetical protein